MHPCRSRPTMISRTVAALLVILSLLDLFAGGTSVSRASPARDLSTSMDRHIPRTAATEGFAQPGDTEGGIQVQVEATGDGGTFLLLEAHVVAPPPRPRASLLPANPAGLLVVFGSREDDAATRQWAAMAQIPYRPWRRTVRDRPTLTRFVRIVNALPVLTGISNGVLDPREASLSFHTRAGHALVFTLDACCAGVRGPGVTLDDTNHALWSAILALAPAT